MPAFGTSGHSNGSRKCPLSGVKRTWPIAPHMSAFDPKRTSGPNISRSPLHRKMLGFKPSTKCVFRGP